MNRIKEIRKKYDITQAQLAEACDMQGQTIQLYESGKRQLTIEKMRQIAKGFTKLGFPTIASDLLLKEDQAIKEDAEPTEKIKSLEEELRQQHDDFLEFLLQKQKDKKQLKINNT